MTVIIVALSFCLVQAGPARADDAAAEGPRIVSFSPALTRILFDMNLGHHVVGVTRFCRLPDGIERPRIGDAETISAETILAVRPDIILTQSLPERFRGVTDAKYIGVRCAHLLIDHDPTVCFLSSRVSPSDK